MPPKKDPKKEAAKPKGAPKALIKKIKEEQQKAKEEEERLQREEEERIKAEEEAERLQKEEEERVKQRKKDKKEREKAKIAQAKKDGTFLTKAQKEKLRRAQANLQALKEQGLAIVPSKDQVQRDKKGRVIKKRPAPNGEQTGDDVTSTADSKTDEAKSGESESDDEDDEDGTDSSEAVEDWEELDPNAPSNQPVPKTAPPTVAKNGPAPVVATRDRKESESTRDKDKENILRSPDEDLYKEPREGTLRSPIICVLGHVDTGKTKLLDYLRKSHVQDNEAGGITQQIGATFFPPTAIHEQSKTVNNRAPELKLPGLLIIDTPGHESFSNLRSRGSSLCDIAILVINIMEGCKQQTIESINLLKARKTPFVVALNQVDRLYSWKANKNKDIEDVIKSQEINTKLEFEKRTKEVILQLNEKGLNAALFYENPNVKEYVSLVPTSAHTGDGIGNLINLLVRYSQEHLHKKLKYLMDTLQASVLEVKAIPGLGTTMDVILVNGFLKEGDKIVVAGHDGPIVTAIRSLLVTQPLKELRVKNPYKELKTVYGAIGVKLTGHDLEKVIAGLELYVARKETDIEELRNECAKRFGAAMKSIKCSEKGVYVQASTLGSLEALLEYLKESKIPYSGVRIGPVVKKDVMKASAMLESSPDHAVILAFDVKVERDAQEMADSYKPPVRIFTAEIIYHLTDQFTAYQNELKQKKKDQFKHLAVFPCKLRILPQFIFNARDPIVLGVSIEDGILVPGTPIAVPSKG